MPELGPEVFPRLVGELIESGNLALERACARVLTAIQARAREKLSENTHRYGEPTTASKGGPPALVSGTLRRSVVHTEPRLAGPGTWEGKVGLAAGFYPPYGHDRTPSSRYGLYLETETGYPWFIPALREVMHGEAAAIFKETFAAARWPHIR